METIMNWILTREGYLISGGAFICGVALMSLVMGRTARNHESTENTSE